MIARPEAAALETLLEQLGLRQAAVVLPDWLDRAASQELSYADFLHGVLEETAYSRLGVPTSSGQAPNARTPAFDLDSVYGHGPAIDPQLYDASDRSKLKVESGGAFEDVPRAADGSAIIGDPRNDDHLVIAGLHAAFLKFHNRAVDAIRDAQRIEQFVIDLCTLIEMRRYGNCQIVHFGDGRVAGFSMTQVIETSLISGHFANETNRAYLDIFSCKAYNPEVVAGFAAIARRSSTVAARFAASIPEPRKRFRLVSDTQSNRTLPVSFERLPRRARPAQRQTPTGYSTSVRNVSAALSRDVYRAYGIADRTPGEFEVDHVVDRVAAATLGSLSIAVGVPRGGGRVHGNQRKRRSLATLHVIDPD